MIKLNVIGHLGRDCTVNTVNQKSVINFAVAHTEKFKDAQGNQRDKTIWIDCSWWSDRTTIAQYLKKGTQIYVEGNPDVRIYTNQQGIASATMTLRVSNIQLLSSNNNNNNTTAPIEANTYHQGSAGVNTSSVPPVQQTMQEPIDDLPF